MKIAKPIIRQSAFPLNTLVSGEVFRGISGDYYMVVNRNVFDIRLLGTSLPDKRVLYVELIHGTLCQSEGASLIFPVKTEVTIKEEV